MQEKMSDADSSCIQTIKGHVIRVESYVMFDLLQHNFTTRTCSVHPNFSPSTSNKRNPSFKVASKLELALTSSEVSKLILSSRFVEKLFVSIGRIEELRFSIKQCHHFSLQKRVISDPSK